MIRCRCDWDNTREISPLLKMLVIADGVGESVGCDLLRIRSKTQATVSTRFAPKDRGAERDEFGISGVARRF